MSQTSSAIAFRADVSRIIKYAPAELIGREAELKLLADAWANDATGRFRACSEDARWSVNVFSFGLLTIILDHLTLGRAALYMTILEGNAGGPLKAAGKLINTCGYHRRDEEPADARQDILGL